MNQYVKLAITLSISLVLMFLLSMSMIRAVDHFHVSLGNFYITLLMVSSMAIVMLVVMWAMFSNVRLNVALLVGFAVLFIGAFALGRSGTLIGDEQFLRSMIPHHSRAILLCQEADIVDPEILALCDEIVAAQQREIDQMEQILRRY